MYMYMYIHYRNICRSAACYRYDVRPLTTPLLPLGLTHP